jgi:SAM-dependent methyltransferase
VDPEQITKADIEFHAATAHLYEDTLAPIFRAHDALVVAPLLDSLERIAPGREALEIGCGTGLFTERLAKQGFSVQGVDHSPAMLAIANQRMQASVVRDQVELQAGDVRALPFEDKRFDLVTCTGVLHHLPELRPCLVEAVRVLRPGGVLLIMEPCVGTNPPLRAWNVIARLWGRARDRLPTRGLRHPEDQAPADSAEPLEIPDHEEGPIDVAELTTPLDELQMKFDLTYWSFFEGLHHRGPLWIQKAVVLLGSRPWRHRSGNLVVLLGRAR